jgi:hypothetical protein
MKMAIAGLPVEALDWQPGPEMNSMAVSVVDTATHPGHIQLTRQMWEQANPL